MGDSNSVSGIDDMLWKGALRGRGGGGTEMSPFFKY